MGRTSIPPARSNRREVLHQVATRLFASRGFHGTSMADIASEVGVHKASLYHWVDSKEDLLYQVLSGALDPLLAQARVVIADDSLDFAAKLRRLVLLHARYTVSHPDVMQVFLAEAKWLPGARGREMRDIRRQYHRLYVEVFGKALEDRAISSPEDLIPVYVNLVFSMTNNLSVWFRHEGSYTITEIAELISDMVLGRIVHDRE